MRPPRDLIELTRVRILLFLREPEAVFWVFVFPIVLAAVLGYAFREPEAGASRIALLTGGDARSVRTLAERLEAAPDLEVQRLEDREEARRRLRSGALDAVVQPGPVVRLLVAPSREGAVAARLRVERALSDEPIAAPLRVEEIAERGSRYVDFLFPGLLGMNLMGTGLWGIGFAIADHRQKKLLRRLLCTPMRRSSFLLSFVLSRFVFLALEVAALLGFALFVLDVPLASGLLPVLTLCALGALSFSGLGLLVASRARTLEGVSGLLNFVMLPMWLLSGVFFSYERFPEVFHPWIRALPLTALNDGLRAFMLDGARAQEVAGEAAILTAWGVVSFLLALRLFRWE